MINPEVDLELSIMSLSAYKVPSHLISNMLNNLEAITSNSFQCAIAENYEECEIWKKNTNGCSDCKYK